MKTATKGFALMALGARPSHRLAHTLAKVSLQAALIPPQPHHSPEVLALTRLRVHVCVHLVCVHTASTTSAQMDAETAECATATDVFSTAFAASPSPATPPVCPDGMQDLIDDLYSECDGQDLDGAGTPWSEQKVSFKPHLERIGCAGAAHTTPALFVAVAAVVNHFLA